MFRFFEEQDDTPRGVQRFEQLWFAAIFASAIVAFDMYDYTVESIGQYPALLANVAFFGASIILMFFTSRRRSNVARMLTIPFLGLILLYDLSHLDELMSRGSAMLYTLGRLGLIVAAIYFLFTPKSRAWFAGRLLSTLGQQED